MRTRGLCELTLESDDHRALARFYRSVLELEVLSEEDDRIWLACGKHTRLGVWAVGEKEFGDRGGRHVHFAFSVARGQLQAVAAQLRELGVECHGPVEHDGGDRSLYFEDPEGNLVELWDYFEDGDGAREGVAALS
ncbi:MAG TPA: VOC family protein [Conexibacter sp.]|nr:VOC family protein [Conexibacter sp.]